MKQFVRCLELVSQAAQFVGFVIEFVYVAQFVNKLTQFAEFVSDFVHFAQFVTGDELLDVIQCHL